MSSSPGRKQAREWLEAQIAELAKLRNASTRDPGFKQWRQYTVTLIQRIWVGDNSRSYRFKRIPFTAAGPRPDRDEVRNAYERGCGEALTVLRELLDELEHPGASAPASHLEPSPMILERLPVAPDEPAEEPDAGPPPPLAIAPLPPPRRALAPGAGSATARATERATPPPARAADRGAPPSPAPRTAATSPAAPLTPAHERQLDADEDELPVLEPEPDTSDEHEAVRRAMSDFLSSSPIFGAMNRMERAEESRAGGPGTPPRLSPSALALAALASELTDLGVPPNQRTRAREALDELAKHIDRRELTWDELRTTVAMVMEFRAVARRVLPLILPFLDEAA